MSKLKMLALVGVMLLAIVLTGCGEEATGSNETAAEASAPGLTLVTQTEYEVGTPGGRFVVGQLSDPKTFNLLLTEETSSTDVTERLQIQLTRRNQFTLDWEPFAAESWEISDDEKSITFTLREGLKWSDGTPITASDWADGITNIVYDENIQTSSRDAYTVGGELAVWEALDDRTLRITVSEVYAGLLNIANSAPLPMHIMGPIYEAEGADGINTLWGIDADVTTIPSSGPFIITEYIPSQRVVFARNPNYFEKDANGNQLPYIEELVYETIPDQDTMLQRFLAGETDWLVVRGEDYASLVDERDTLGFKIMEVGPATGTNFITFNQNPIEGEDDAGIADPELSWLSTKDFRVAMAHLIDRETLINNVSFGFGYPQYSFVPRFSPYYWNGVDEAAYKYDPVRSAELLDALGWVDNDGDGIREDADGNKISLDLVTNSGNRVREAIGAAFTQEALNVGIEINFQPIDFNALVGQLLDTYDWELILIGLTGSVDPISGANVYPSNGNLHMIEPNQESPRRDWEKAVDEAWEVANNTTSEAQRVAGYETLQRIWADEIPWVYTYNVLVMEAYKSNLGNVIPQPVENYDWEGILHRIYYK
jgi:peptide/nickel transport system substrate-binding protein